MSTHLAEEIANADINMSEDADEIDTNISSRGVPLKTMQTLRTTDPLPVANNYNHTVMYKLPLGSGIPQPYPGKLCWDRDHVKMPFSSHSLYATLEENVDCLKPRWDLIQRALSRSIKTTQDLQEAILTYNPKYKNKWNFSGLHILFNEILEEEETNYFFSKTLPSIIQLALQLPRFMTTALPHLRQNRNHSISLSQQQISSLLANAFLCTFPHRNTQKKQSEYNMFPDINFNRLYDSGSMAQPHVIEKIKCICHYFRRVCTKPPQYVVTFTRQHIPSTGLPNWQHCTKKLGDMKIHITSEGTIEDQGVNMLQVDFANKFIGGGVLGWGCVQEEIRFVICPELIVSRLFTEALKPNESLIITGCERYSQYTGYSQSFMWAGDYKDETPCDSSGRRKTTLVAIDALHFTNSKHQFMPRLIERELNKAYVGFRSPIGDSNSVLQPVATGNWGCGAFGGDATLKALIQMMSARFVERDFVYFTFGDRKLCDNIYTMWCYWRDNKVTIGQIFNYLCEFHKSNTPVENLYPFLMKMHLDDKKNSIMNHIYSKNIRPSIPDKKLPGYNPFSVTNKSQLISTNKPGTSRSPKKNILSEEEIEQCFKDDFGDIDDGVKPVKEVSAKVELKPESLLDRLSALEGNMKTYVEVPESENSDSDLDDNNVPKILVNYVNETNKSERLNNNKVSQKDTDATSSPQRKISDFFSAKNKK